ncbi:glycosyl hydrolase [Cordyceps fumosorosea ARSEF 2679]|uniref:Glycosyl hydrolase n=1 Tax=Cordyceps fumosorosea (strain ARSEF 2679) TaxID=1081104 RepID=A0A167XD92_CORFA|nr:glycosyl hydrolase [Cordyceps fumosorosea ARSEF 2679]OAA64834.1 glycosyl hydrolase [Cordyceps fumosorosea ARSEF 2679]
MEPSSHTSHAGRSRREHTGGYLPIEDYGVIGNMHTCALIGIDGSVDFMPDFDSPSVFCRLLDKNKGGYFNISPPPELGCTTKQQYLPSSCLLQTRYIHEDGVADVIDFFPRPKSTKVISRSSSDQGLFREAASVQAELKKWLVRRVECVRGFLTIDVEIFPAFDYGQEAHVTTLYQDTQGPAAEKSKVATFHSKDVKLQLDVVAESANEEKRPSITFIKQRRDGMLGEGLVARVEIRAGEALSFVLRNDIENHVDEVITTELLDMQQHDTLVFWQDFVAQSKYKGRWVEVVSRSLMILKMLTYEPTGAIVAAPTFSVPEHIGGERNWDYRYCWVRDSSFTIYILLRLGFKAEADAYMTFIMERLQSRLPGDALPIMFTIRGETDIPELTLDHLDGYRGSRPVRIGNGAAFHKQFDIYGELMDGIYLYNKYGKPVPWDLWVAVRELLDYVLTIKDEPDNSIWEVRNQRQHFTYSKVMLWVAFDRGLRLAEKRCFPCPNRAKWMEARDSLCEEIMTKGYNKELGCFVQSYENNTMLDSSILIAPLVFFISPCDPRFIKTLDKILLPPEQGGLTSTGLVYRYDAELSDDGVGGREGAFSMCTFWLVEAMTRASVYEPKYRSLALNLFQNMLSFSNHLSMFSEEIARSGEQLGNTPQAFSHLALISAAFNLDRAAGFWK